MRGVTGWIRRRCCCCYFAGCFDFASDAPTPRRVQPKTINATADQAGGGGNSQGGKFAVYSDFTIQDFFFDLKDFGLEFDREHF